MATAERYFLDLLKWKWEDFLLQNLTIENGSELLMLADVHDAVNLKESAVEFIRKFPAEVKKTDGWKDLKKCLPNTRRKMEIIFIFPPFSYFAIQQKNCYLPFNSVSLYTDRLVFCITC